VVQLTAGPERSELPTLLGDWQNAKQAPWYNLGQNTGSIGSASSPESRAGDKEELHCEEVDLDSVRDAAGAASRLLVVG